MSKDELTAALSGLQAALVPPDETADGEAWNDAFHDALDRVVALDDAAAVAPLLLLLDDDYEFQDILESLPHVAASFNRERYLSGFLAAMPTLATRAPDWATSLTGRVLNSTAYRVALAETLAGAPAETRAAFRGIFDALRRRNAAQFADEIEWVEAQLEAANNR